MGRGKDIGRRKDRGRQKDMAFGLTCAARAPHPSYWSVTMGDRSGAKMAGMRKLGAMIMRSCPRWPGRSTPPRPGCGPSSRWPGSYTSSRTSTARPSVSGAEGVAESSCSRPRCPRPTICSLVMAFGSALASRAGVPTGGGSWKGSGYCDVGSLSWVYSRCAWPTWPRGARLVPTRRWRASPPLSLARRSRGASGSTTPSLLRQGSRSAGSLWAPAMCLTSLTCPGRRLPEHLHVARRPPD